MRIIVEQDFYGLKPDYQEHWLLRHAMKIQLDRQKAGNSTVRDLPTDRFKEYVATGYEVPRQPAKMEWPTVQPLLASLIFMGSNNLCSENEADRTCDMIEELHSAGEEYITTYLDSILGKYLDQEVDITYIVD